MPADSLPDDPMERRLAEALVAAGVRFTTDPRDTAGLDFRLLDPPIYIEVKRMHSDRIAGQMARADNVIAVQGEQAVIWLSSVISALSASPARGEGDAPVAWKIEWRFVPPDYPVVYPGGGSMITEKRADMERQVEHLRKWDGVDTFKVTEWFTHPTPATPEGLRAFGLSPLDVERIRSSLIDGLEKAYWAGSEVSQGFDATKEADAILAALQPQAEGE